MSDDQEQVYENEDYGHELPPWVGFLARITGDTEKALDIAHGLDQEPLPNEA